MDMYKRFLTRFLAAGYEFVEFTDEVKPSGQVILRHDIDFDIEFALKIAQANADLGIAASFFFLVSSDSYNLLSERNRELVRQIISHGQVVGLHFDPDVHPDQDAGLAAEKTLFETTLDVECKIVSFHRPARQYIDSNYMPAGMLHTYLPQFFSDIGYYSDSRGQFRFGNPLDSGTFAERKTIHLLLHPIWWVGSEFGTPLPVLDSFVEKKNLELQQHVADNCLPFRHQFERQNSASVKSTASAEIDSQN